jgi:CMP-N,N'-diacetyllegionaminic acid synthase
MKIIGLIPARGGSKGVPGKNIKALAGKPLIAYTIEQALKSRLLDRVIVSTDDPDIAKTSVAYGAEVPFMRPAELAQDHSGSLEVVRHALDFFEERGQHYDAVCLLQATSPYRPKGCIDEAIRLFMQKQPDSLISVRRVPDEFNPHWTFEIEEDGRLRISTGDEKIIPRRQDLPPAYHRDGAIYISLAETIRNKGSLLGDDILAFPIDSPKLINIDTMDDWYEAERFFGEKFKFEV